MSEPSYLEADDDDCWLRNITNSDHVTRDGRLHRQALKSPALSRSRVPSQPWSHELSGRLKSRAHDFLTDGEAAVQQIRDKLMASGRAVPSKIGFLGWACSSVQILKTAPGKCSVVHEPTPDDPAHANFVLYNVLLDDDLETTRGWLQGHLQVVKKDDLSALDEACKVR